MGHKKILLNRKGTHIVHSFPPLSCSFIYKVQPSFIKLYLTVVWRDVKNKVGSRFEFSMLAEGNSYDLYHPLKIHIPKY